MTLDDARNEIVRYANRLMSLGQLMKWTITSADGNLADRDTLRTEMELLEDIVNTLDRLEDEFGELYENNFRDHHPNTPKNLPEAEEPRTTDLRAVV
jgi:hypothetical protein